MKKLLLVLVLTCSNTVNAQQVNAETGNIVYTTLNPPPSGAPHSWTGFINSNTSGGGFSGGNVPAYNGQTGTFIFGYNQGTVSYATSINFALANAGTGIQVNGFKYSWQYFNQDFSRGTLSGNISLTNSSGSVIQSYGYNMPQTTQGWTAMSGIQNFNTQYAPSTLGNLQVSFTGKDDRWWAGYYGPQIRAIDVRMLYGIAPPVTDWSQWIKLTDENGTFTLNKSGVVRYGAQGVYEYKNFEPGTYSCSNGAWGNDPIGGVYKSCSLGSNAPPPSPLPTTNTASTNNTVTTYTEPTTSPTTTTTNTIADTSSTSTPTSTVTSPVASSGSSGQVTSTTSAATTSTTTSTPVATVSTSSPSNNTRSVDGTGIGLSLVARNAQREQSIAMQASQSAVAAAEQTAQQAQQEAVSVAQTSNAASNVSSANPTARINLTTQRSEQVVTQTQTTQTSSLVSTLSQPGVQVQTARSTDANRFGLTSSVSVESVSVQSSPLNIAIQEQTTNNQTQSLFSLLPPQQVQQTIVPVVPVFASDTAQSSQPLFSTNQQTTFATNETPSSDSQKFLTDKSNPINQILESKPEIQSSSNVQPKTTVNTNASDNEIAGGVGLARMATTPPGYNQYLNLIIADASFYAPKEIYRGQRTVDNVRALRAMSSDRLHQQMVDSQYERK